MGSGSQVVNQVRLSRTKANSDIYQLPISYFCWTTNLQSTVATVCGTDGTPP